MVIYVNGASSVILSMTALKALNILLFSEW